jgi:membrane peptidoglycan carboxypeptidase
VRVENASGETVWSPEPLRVPAMSPEESWLMVDMLKDVVRRGTAAGSVGSQFPHPAGGKTGTTNDGTDVWYIGFTTDLVAGVWIGLDKPEKIKANAQGGLLAAPAWTAFMNEAYRRKPPPPDWPRPAGIVTKRIDMLTNTEWTPGCPGIEATEHFVVGTEPVIPCSLMPGLTTDTSGYLYPPPGSGAQPSPIIYPRDSVAARAPTVFRDTSRARRDSVRARADSLLRPPRTDSLRGRRDSAGVRQQGRRRPPI